MENYLFEDLNLSKYPISVRILQKQRGPLKLPRKRWLDDVENDLKRMSVRNRRETSMDREAWKFIIWVAKFLPGP
jgi:hypothetical protein